MIDGIINWVSSAIANLSYFDITALMAIESSLIPFPSEVVMPPAGYLAATGKLNIWLALAAGTLGSLIGAIFNYYLALFLGRKMMHAFARSRWAKLILFDEEKLVTAEQYFKTKGKLSTFIGRFIPAVRQLISLPAGLAKMDLATFLALTGLGAGLWCFILLLLGYFFGANQELLKQYYHQLWLIGIGIFIVTIIYFIFKHVRTLRK